VTDGPVGLGTIWSIYSTANANELNCQNMTLAYCTLVCYHKQCKVLVEEDNAKVGVMEACTSDYYQYRERCKGKRMMRVIPSIEVFFLLCRAKNLDGAQRSRYIEGGVIVAVVTY
jgi:hypothetical protein